MRQFIQKIRRFGRAEDGNATVEFAILFPFFVFMFCAAVELGMVTFRHSMLERGLDLAVRNVRLTTAADYQHDDIKQMACDFAGILPNCMTQLHLEMQPLDMRNFTAPSRTARCSDITQVANPLKQFSNGQQNQMMVLRACFVFKPVFPLTGLGRHLDWDGNGHAWMIATSAFVQEPL
ncbi:TadE/TadG family type IV pilus assembly protein [Lentibacter sp. XHP0401]|jgi:TadE-like protein|uniref:TadE/TadG family type IV pilus assembly protein n=1 Tax=Lentibacter sp. XHP0401 TaxID=2984334 RepID=UPI0021E85BC0|nr:TadE family protein [Lentibacter sp. XHP0401]MCV2892998.1 pilus assembly protein [Lentibacter sp. XHP0401]